MRRFILLNPGPVNVDERVRRSMLRMDICHREEEFSFILKGVRQKIVRAFGIEKDYTVVIFNSSGTGSLEAAIISSISPNGKLLIINNGIYGERIAKIASVHNIDKAVLNFGFGSPVDLPAIRRALENDKRIEAVAMVHHETSTGMLNPVHNVGVITKRLNRIFIIDSISGLAGEELNFRSSNIGVCVGTVYKCIESITGLSFVIIKKSIITEIERYPKRSFYFDIINNLRDQENGATSFTPSVQLYYALDKALDILIKEGVANRIKRYRDISNVLRNGFRRLGLRFYLQDEGLSNTLTALYLPAGVSYSSLHDALKKKGFIIYAGQSKLKDKIFRVANMGNLTKTDARRFLKTLKDVLSILV